MSMTSTQSGKTSSSSGSFLLGKGVIRSNRVLGLLWCIYIHACKISIHYIYGGERGRIESVMVRKGILNVVYTCTSVCIYVHHYTTCTYATSLRVHICTCIQVSLTSHYA